MKTNIAGILLGWYMAMSTPIPTSDLLALPPAQLLAWMLVGTVGVLLVGVCCYDLGYSRGRKRA